MSSCEPAWQRPLSIRVPKGPPPKRVRWFRENFYRLAQEERRATDGGDRVRRLLRQFPKVAAETYQANQQHLRERRKEGKEFGNLDLFYMLMNEFIEQTLPDTLLSLRIKTATKSPSSPEPSPTIPSPP